MNTCKTCKHWGGIIEHKGDREVRLCGTFWLYVEQFGFPLESRMVYIKKYEPDTFPGYQTDADFLCPYFEIWKAE